MGELWGKVDGRVLSPLMGVGAADCRGRRCECTAGGQGVSGEPTVSSAPMEWAALASQGPVCLSIPYRLVFF